MALLSQISLALPLLVFLCFVKQQTSFQLDGLSVLPLPTSRTMASDTSCRPSRRWMQQRPSPSKLFLSAPTQEEKRRKGRSFPIKKTDDEWKEILTSEQYYVLRKEGTETPGASPLNNIKPDVDAGTFCCAGCGAPLFVADTKFESGTGWPSFYAPITNSAIALDTDYKLLFPRTECSCAQCGGHLGHVFEDGPEPTGQRFCMNGAAMQYYPDGERPDLADAVSQSKQDDPFRVSPQQILPSVVVNGLITAFFLSSFVTSDQASPVAFLTILPAFYYGFIVVKSISKLLER